MRALRSAGWGKTAVASGILLALAPASLSAAIQGSLEWTRTISTTGSDRAFRITADGSGNSYVVGETSGVLAPGGTGGTNAFVRKYDLGGNVVWTNQYGGVGIATNANAVAVDANNLYVAGSSSSTPTSGTGYVRKYDLSGNLIWHRDITPVDEFVQAVTVDASGNVYVGGGTTASLAQTNGGSNDAFIRKYDSAGTVQWTRQFGNVGDDIVRGLTIDPSGNLVSIGQVATNVLGVPGSNGGTFVRKYDPAGSALWTQGIGSAGNELGTSVDTDASGNVYVAGRTPLATYGPYGGNNDDFAAKFDSAGNFIWGKQIGTSFFETLPAIATDDAGNSLLVSGGGNFDPSYSGQEDAFVIAMDAAGLTLWTQEYGTNLNNEGRGVAMSADGRRAWITGIDFATGANGDDSFVRALSIPEPGVGAMLFISLTATRRRRV